MSTDTDTQNTAIASKAPKFAKGKPKALSVIPEAQVSIPMWGDITKDSSEKLVSTMGIELTMIPSISGPEVGSKGRHNHSIADKLADAVGYAMKHIGMDCHACHGDFNAVEVASEILDTWGEVVEFYDKVSDIMRRVGCAPHHPHLVSGGGHIHVGGLSVREMVSLFRDAANRPYLMWIMNDPDDDKSANSFVPMLAETIKPISSLFTSDDDLDDDGEDFDENPARKRKIDTKMTMRDMAMQLTFDISPLVRSLSSDGKLAITFYAKPELVSKESLHTNKNAMLRYDESQETLEFRFLEAPLNREEQIAHVKFVDAYVRWARKKYAGKKYCITDISEAKVKKWTLPEIRLMFSDFLTELGLPLAPYARMLDENLEQRAKRGKLI